MVSEEKQVIVYNINITDIEADDDFNCRGPIAPMDVLQLSQDIKERGLIQPVVVRPNKRKPRYDGEVIPPYSLVAGFRRHKAHLILMLSTIPCIIREGMSENDARVMNLSENLQRQDLNIMQEALAVKKIMENMKSKSRQEIGEALGQSQGWVQIRIMVLELPEEIKKEVSAGFINQNQIRELHSLHKKGEVAKVEEGVRKIKDHKLAGKTGTVDLKQLSTDPSKEQRERRKPDMYKALKHIYDNVGPCFATRCLAWAAGEISDADLFVEIKTIMTEIEKPYLIPDTTVAAMEN